MDALLAFLITLSVALVVFSVYAFKREKKALGKFEALSKDINSLKELNSKLKQNLKEALTAIEALEEHKKGLENKATIYQIRNTKLKLENENLKKSQKEKL